jgi:hypothetical protein
LRGRKQPPMPRRRNREVTKDQCAEAYIIFLLVVRF